MGLVALRHVGSSQKWSEVKLLSRVWLCDPMDCSLLHSSVHGIFQARVLEWVAISFSRGSSWPRNQTQVSHTVGRCFTVWVTREVRDLPRPGIKPVSAALAGRFFTTGPPGKSRVFFIYLCVAFFGSDCFFVYFQISLWYHFSSTWITFFSISYGVSR